jgi:hypothetical protein
MDVCRVCGAALPVVAVAPDAIVPSRCAACLAHATRRIARAQLDRIDRGFTMDVQKLKATTRGQALQLAHETLTQQADLFDVLDELAAAVLEGRPISDEDRTQLETIRSRSAYVRADLMSTLDMLERARRTLER